MKEIVRLLRAVKRAHEDGHDTVWIITGMEGMGKSNLLLDIIDSWGRLVGIRFTIETVGLTPAQWVNAISTSPERYGVPSFDEAGDGLLSRDAMADFNKDVIKMYTVIRGKGLFTILVLPSFWYLDKFFRMHRVKGLFYVYGRGRVAFWNRRQIKIMTMRGEDQQDVWCVRPSLRDRFPLYKGELLEDYQRLKKDKIAQTIQAMREKYVGGEESLTEIQAEVLEWKRKGLKGREIAEQLRMSGAAVSQHLKAIKSKGVEVPKA